MIDDAQLVRQLMGARLIDSAGVARAQKLMAPSGTSFYETVVAHGLVDERTVVRVVSQMLNVPHVFVGDQPIPPHIAGVLPAEVATRLRVLPLQLAAQGTTRQLYLAMADPHDIDAMEEIASLTGANVNPVLIGPVDIERALERHYPSSATASAAPELPPEPPTPQNFEVMRNDGFLASEKAAEAPPAPMEDWGDAIERTEFDDPLRPRTRTESVALAAASQPPPADPAPAAVMSLDTQTVDPAAIREAAGLAARPSEASPAPPAAKPHPQVMAMLGSLETTVMEPVRLAELVAAAPAPNPTPSTDAMFDALLRILIAKGIVTREQVETEARTRK